MDEKPYRILMAEDDATIREIWGELLSGEGFECVLAEDGQAAKEKIEQEKIDLLISDFRMPRMDGVQLLNWCRESDHHFPVIFISANHDLLPKEEVALGDCCAALLRKPAGLDEILVAIQAAKARNHRFMCQPN